jgi:hypothetical protein
VDGKAYEELVVSLSSVGPLLTLSVFFAHIVGVAKPWAGVRWRATAAVGAKGAPTALRCSGFGRTE